MQNVYSVKENVNNLNRDSLFFQGSKPQFLRKDTKPVNKDTKPVNIETSYPNNLNNFRTGAVKFVGRDKDIKDLHEQLQEKERVSITAVVTGMAGVGKTELALQYSLLSEKELKYPGGICWINVREKSVGEQLLSFAKTQLGLFPPEDWSLEDRISYCLSNWQPPGDVLIVLDDVNKYEEIEQYFRQKKQRFKLLVTTRKKWLTQSFQRLELAVLDEDSALELLMSYVEHSRIEAELQEAKELCKDLGFLPLGLELIARYLERQPSLSLVEVRKTLGLENKSLERFSQDMTAQRGVVAAFELSWNELDEDSKALGCLL
ncbi:MAG: NB-ARC domain-containing protein, partial [Trichodesmium sp. St18_bin1]|nr:NB-ARC domain-containing protein [Trichodesmium sp. St18_bin1]